MIRFKNLSVAALAVLALLVAGCNDGGGPVSPNTQERALVAEWKLLKENSTGQSLAGTLWRWYSIDGDCMLCRWDPAYPSSFGNRAYTLEFKNDGTLKMYSWVNEFFGTYTVVNRGNDVVYKINIKDFVGTKVGLIDGDPYEQYMREFPKVTAFALQEDQLTLFYNDGEHYLQFFSLNEYARCKERSSLSQAKSLCVPHSPEF